MVTQDRDKVFGLSVGVVICFCFLAAQSNLASRAVPFRNCRTMRSVGIGVSPVICFMKKATPAARRSAPVERATLPITASWSNDFLRKRMGLLHRSYSLEGGRRW
jgi:hypothetical protein